MRTYTEVEGFFQAVIVKDDQRAQALIGPTLEWLVAHPVAFHAKC